MRNSSIKGFKITYEKEALCNAGLVRWIIRALLFLFILFLVTELLGKKQLSQLSYFEYVVGITIGSIGAEVITGLERNISVGVIGIVTTAAISFLIEEFLWKEIPEGTFNPSNRCIFFISSIFPMLIFIIFMYLSFLLFYRFITKWIVF
ncbi:hypothetical protein [Peribacillus sp. NPDC096448]|uniref:hypothetical protein n=1 Tax=Peribacillus sp. NPDC096448 TaxID=3364395 RepID=UPI00382A55ED